MKTKVVAIRITENQYEALQLWSKQHNMTITQLLKDFLASPLTAAEGNLRTERKRAEAKAKRDAKKAAANGAQ